jgi:hypothetical protein
LAPWADGKTSLLAFFFKGDNKTWWLFRLSSTPVPVAPPNVVGLAHDNDDDGEDKEEEDSGLVTRAERALENEPWNTVGGVEGETFLHSVWRVSS